MLASKCSFGHLILVASLVAPLSACGSDDPRSDDASSSAEDSGGDGDADSAETSSASQSTTATGGDGDGDDGSSDTGNTGGECVLWQEDDCVQEGQKCMPWSSEDDNIPDENRCCDVVDNPKLIGEACTAIDYWGSCLDDCEKGSMCLVDSADGLTGYCQPFCDINQGDSACPPGEACKPWFEMIETAQTVPLCMAKCNPLEQNCTELGRPGWTCLPEDANDPSFLCTPPSTGTLGMEYDTCLLANTCEIGLACVPQDMVFGCEDALVGCCTRYCDTTEPDTCTNGNECVSVEATEPGLENVGVCASPL